MISHSLEILRKARSHRWCQELSKIPSWSTVGFITESASGGRVEGQQYAMHIVSADQSKAVLKQAFVAGFAALEVYFKSLILVVE